MRLSGVEHCYIIEYQDILHCPGKHGSVGWNSDHSVQCTGRSRVQFLDRAGT